MAHHRKTIAAIGKYERPELLRVVRCLPPAAGLSANRRTQRAGVLRASREETAGCWHAVMEDSRAMGIRVLTFRYRAAK